MWWTDVFFIIGSACFAVASVPGIASAVGPGPVGVTYFVGSVFFTSAGFLQYQSSVADGPRVGGRRVLAWLPHDADSWASLIQFAGTLWFNVNTFDAMQGGLSTKQEDLRIWTPDFVGSICFLVASGIAWWTVARPWRDPEGDIPLETALLNLVGSLLFMAAALAAFVRPSTTEMVDATTANSGTLLGALCFLGAAWLDARRGETPVDSVSGRDPTDAPMPDPRSGTGHRHGAEPSTTGRGRARGAPRG